jgi:hypothetical protein
MFHEPVFLKTACVLVIMLTLVFRVEVRGLPLLIINEAGLTAKFIGYSHQGILNKIHKSNLIRISLFFE